MKAGNITKSKSIRDLNYTNIFWIVLAHILAIVAIPYFSWNALLLCAVGVFIVAPLGVNVGYHRLLTHKSFTAPIWFRDTLVTIGALIGAGAPLVWAAEHRVHHRYSDQEMDPHNSNIGFWYSHVFHLFYSNSFQTDEAQWSKYVPDLMTDRYLVWLNKNWLWMAVLTLVPFYYFGGWQYVLWGGFFRLACTWNIMWLVNSASHKWGYRNFNTTDNTRNCWWVGLLAAGEGWHNNHHAYQNCAAHGQRWWEFDFSYQLIRFFELIGLAKNVRKTMPIGSGDALNK